MHPSINRDLIGKKFRYKSKYGLSSWVGTIDDVFWMWNIKGKWKLNEEHEQVLVIEVISNGVYYRLDEIEII